MNLFTCRCGWSYLLGRKRFYGPIFDGGDASSARMQPIEQFEEGYGDCWVAWHRAVTARQSAHPD